MAQSRAAALVSVRLPGAAPEEFENVMVKADGTHGVYHLIRDRQAFASVPIGHTIVWWAQEAEGGGGGRRPRGGGRGRGPGSGDDQPAGVPAGPAGPRRSAGEAHQVPR